MVAMSFMYIQAARWTRRILFCMNAITVLGLVYTIPSNACGIVSGVVCFAWQWSAILVAFVSSVVSGMALAYDMPDRLRMFEESGSALLKLSRRIGLELDKRPAERTDGSQFASDIVREFDAIIENSRLPWFINGEDQLANISLLRSYEQAHFTSTDESSEEVVGGDGDGETSNPSSMIRMTQHDKLAMDHFERLINRIDDVTNDIPQRA